MKQCRNCREWKDEDEFPWRNQLLGTRQNICKTCMARQSRDWYSTHREQQKETVKVSKAVARDNAKRFIYEYLSYRRCVECGEYDFSVLTFDHVRGVKKKEISVLVADGASIEALKEELAKCEVVCANCHMRREQKRRSGGRFRKFWPKFPGEK